MKSLEFGGSFLELNTALVWFELLAAGTTCKSSYKQCLFPAPMHQEFCTAQPFAVATKTRATVLKPTLPLSLFLNLFQRKTTVVAWLEREIKKVMEREKGR